MLARSIPVAATSAMATAIEVSSVHSPGAHLNGPPPIMSIVAATFGYVNSYPAPSASPAAVPSSTPAARSACCSFSLTSTPLRNFALTIDHD